jgi:hypothetical protein
MSDQITLQALDGSDDAQRILDEFEQRTGLRGDRVGDTRTYELHDADHRTRIIQTLTRIDASWTDHVGFKMPA